MINHLSIFWLKIKKPSTEIWRFSLLFFFPLTSGKWKAQKPLDF
jgi:hypothetical protein